MQATGPIWTGVRSSPQSAARAPSVQKRTPMSVKRRYLLGKGELLAEQVDLPRGGGTGDEPYTMPDAQRYLRPRIKKASLVLDSLTPAACPNDEGVVVFTLHPKYLP